MDEYSRNGRRRRSSSYLHVLIAVSASVLGAAPASACIMPDPFTPAEVLNADAVVVGRISNYRIIIDQKGRDQDLRWFFKTGRWDSLSRYFAPPGRRATDYARFDIAVDEVLWGKVALKLTVTENYAGTRTRAGPYLTALHRPVWPRQEPALLTVFIPPCADSYIFDAGSAQAQVIRSAIRNPQPVPRPEPAPPPPDLIRPVWSAFPSRAQMALSYPARSRSDEVEGSATIQCTATRTGGLINCKTSSETPRGYGFGDATVKLFQAEARLKTGTFTPGGTVRLTWRWQLD